MLDPEISTRVTDFNKKLEDRLDDNNFRLEGEDNALAYLDVDGDLANAMDPAYGDNTPSDEEYGTMGNVKSNDVEEYDEDTYDRYIGAQFRLDDSDDGGRLATVKRRVKDYNGNMVGRSNNNPLLDTAEYEVELEDGTTDKVFANTIAQNIYSQLDSEGQEHAIFDEIIDHKKDGGAISIEDGYTGEGTNRKPKKTTRGWKVLVQWKDESTSWMSVTDVRDANPVELAEYAVANKINHEPAFAWWVPYTLKKRNRIISRVKSKYWKTTHKYGIRIPKSPQEAVRLDRENDGNRFWQDAMDKEMKKAKVAYKPKEGVTPEEIRKGKVDDMRGYQEIKCNIIFDVKMDFTRKARYVAGGHMTEAPVAITYSSVVSRDSVRLAFLIAALNDLNVACCDIGNAYLNAPCKEKIWFVAGPECGEYNGKPMILVRALYGLKSSGASWRSMFKEFIEQALGFTNTRVDADADVYRRRNRKDYIAKSRSISAPYCPLQ